MGCTRSLSPMPCVALGSCRRSTTATARADLLKVARPIGALGRASKDRWLLYQSVDRQPGVRCFCGPTRTEAGELPNITPPISCSRGSREWATRWASDGSSWDASPPSATWASPTRPSMRASSSTPASSHRRGLVADRHDGTYRRPIRPAPPPPWRQSRRGPGLSCSCARSHPHKAPTTS